VVAVSLSGKLNPSRRNGARSRLNVLNAEFLEYKHEYVFLMEQHGELLIQ